MHVLHLGNNKLIYSAACYINCIAIIIRLYMKIRISNTFLNELETNVYLNETE